MRQLALLPFLLLLLAAPPARAQTRIELAGLHGTQPTLKVQVGKHRTLHGRVFVDDQPVSGGFVNLYTHTPGSNAAPTYSYPIRVGTDGRFKERVDGFRSVVLSFSYGNGPQPLLASVRLAVTPKLTINVAPRAARRSGRVKVSGKLDLGGGYIPTGIRVELQAWSNGRWLTFREPFANHKTGAYSAPFSFQTLGAGTYKFRARVPHQVDFLFEPARSRVITVHVR